MRLSSIQMVPTPVDNRMTTLRVGHSRSQCADLEECKNFDRSMNDCQ